MRLSVPSYLEPGTWLENSRAAAGVDWISGVELLFFAYDEEARAILRRERAGLADLAGRLEFSLHLPDPLGPADEALVEATRSFVKVYVLHPPLGAGVPAAAVAGAGASAASASPEAWAELVAAWRVRYGDDFLLEYTGEAAFAAAEAALPGLPLCPDTGVLLREGRSPAVFFRGVSPRVREIHLHGLAADPGGAAAPGPAAKDHAPFRAGEPWLAELLGELGGYEGRIELEIFDRASAFAAREALEETLSAGMKGGRP
ncbi:MAG: AP endonuclease [Spirochaetaceae bacterium]|nr:AP endonuclease [Spirochaetaceae bacterium]